MAPTQGYNALDIMEIYQHHDIKVFNTGPQKGFLIWIRNLGIVYRELDPCLGLGFGLFIRCHQALENELIPQFLKLPNTFGIQEIRDKQHVN